MCISVNHPFLPLRKVENARPITTLLQYICVADFEGPTITFCPEDLQVATGANGSFVVPTWEMPNTTDNGDTSTLTSNYDGEPLPLGSTTSITYTALDASGNMAFCSFSVTITGE